MTAVPSSLQALGLSAADLSVDVQPGRNDMVSGDVRDGFFEAIRDKMFPNAAARPENSLALAKMFCIAYFAINSASSGPGSFTGNSRISGEEYRNSIIIEVVGKFARQFARSFADAIHDYLVINPDLAEQCAKKVGFDVVYKFYAFDVAEYCSEIPVDVKAEVIRHFGALARASAGGGGKYVLNSSIAEESVPQNNVVSTSSVSEPARRVAQRSLV